MVIFCSFLIGNIVTNAGLYWERLSEIFNGVSIIHPAAASDNIAFIKSKKNQYLEALFAKTSIETKKSVKEKVYGYYKDKSKSLEWQFNTLPPDNRIIIKRLGTQAPIVIAQGDLDNKIKEWEFSEELKQWVAFYPGTSEPTEKWTMMLLWHTSNYPWIKSDYNRIFSKIPDLKVWDIIDVYRNGKHYEYAVTKQEIVKPKDVPKAYAQEFDLNKRKLVLMGCYPVGTRTNRVLVYAEPVEDIVPSATTNLAYHPSHWNN